MKATKFANAQTSYEYETERRQAKKASQSLRKQKQSRKMQWVSGE